MPVSKAIVEDDAEDDACPESRRRPTETGCVDPTFALLQAGPALIIAIRGGDSPFPNFALPDNAWTQCERRL